MHHDHSHRRWYKLPLIIAAVALFGALVWLLWNSLIPQLFSGPVLSYWQALGILLLTHILVRGWWPHSHSPRRRWFTTDDRLVEYLSTLTPEERDRILAKMKSRTES